MGDEATLAFTIHAVMFIHCVQDTAGEERYASLSSFYCRGASVAILAFDLTDSRSLEKLRSVFIPLLEDSVDACLPMVVGTKLDLVGTRGRQVKSNDGRELAVEELQTFLTRALKSNPNSYLKGVDGRKLYFETSAKTGEGVSELFEYIQSIVLPQLEKVPQSRKTKSPSVKGAKPQERSIRLDTDHSSPMEPRSKCCGGRDN